jgi:hypothetical protein
VKIKVAGQYRTPKQVAKQLVIDRIEEWDAFGEGYVDLEKLTPKQFEAVRIQVVKYTDRLLRKLKP